MIEITKPVVLDETFQTEVSKISEALEHQNLLISRLVPDADATPVATLNEIHEIVQAGDAPNVFNYGDQIFVNYNNGSNDYILPFDVVHFDDVVLEDGETVPGMFIQCHYAMQPVQFDGNEAFYISYDGTTYADLRACCQSPNLQFHRAC